MLAIQAGTETIIWEKGSFVSFSPIQIDTVYFLQTAYSTPATCLMSSLVLAIIITYGLGSFRSTRIIAGIPNAKVLPDPFVA